MNPLLWLSGGNIYIGILFIGTMIFSIYAQMKVHSTFREYSKVPTDRNLSGVDLAQDLKERFGMDDLSIDLTPGLLTDHYNPKTKSLGLSQDVAGNRSIASLAIVAHEMGHARQHAERMAFLRFRNQIFPVTNLASNAAIPIFLLGLWIGSAGMMNIGVLLFGLVSLFYLVTLPIEIDASKRGLAMLVNGGYLNSTELKGARSVLNAAALTYIAALASSLATLMRLLFLNSRR